MHTTLNTLKTAARCEPCPASSPSRAPPPCSESGVSRLPSENRACCCKKRGIFAEVGNVSLWNSSSCGIIAKRIAVESGGLVGVYCSSAFLCIRIGNKASNECAARSDAQGENRRFSSSPGFTCDLACKPHDETRRERGDRIGCGCPARRFLNECQEKPKGCRARMIARHPAADRPASCSRGRAPCSRSAERSSIPSRARCRVRRGAPLRPPPRRPSRPRRCDQGQRRCRDRPRGCGRAARGGKALGSPRLQRSGRRA